MRFPSNGLVVLCLVPALLIAGSTLVACQRDGAPPAPQSVTSASPGSGATPASSGAPAAAASDAMGTPAAVTPHEAARRSETFGPDGGPRIPSEPVQEAPR